MSLADHQKADRPGKQAMLCPITADSIVAQLISSGRFINANKAFTRDITTKVRDLRHARSDDLDLSVNFSTDEMKTALCVKPNKAAGVDKIHPEFILHQGDKANEWLRVILSVCLRTSKIPKSGAGPRSSHFQSQTSYWTTKGYLPASLLCVPYNFMECLLHACINSVIDPKLPKEQVGFRHGKSTVDQVTLLTNDIEDMFEVGEKAGIVRLDHTAAYDTVCLRGLHLKLLQTLSDRHLVDFILEMLTNCSFTLHTSDGQHSRLRRLKNCILQGSVLTPMPFNIDLPPTLGKKYGYADNLAILLSDKHWETIEEGLLQTCQPTLPQELAPKAQRHECHVLLIPSQQSTGKARAQSHGG